MTATPATPVTWHDRPSADARAALAPLLDLLVPASADGRMPAASQAGPLAPGPGADSRVQQLVDGWQDESRRRFGCELASLDASRRQALLDDWRQRDPQAAQRLALEVLTWYYQQDRVLEAIGLEARPPFPKGHAVDPGDWSLLQPVIDRGRVYRDVS